MHLAGISDWLPQVFTGTRQIIQDIRQPAYYNPDFTPYNINPYAAAASTLPSWLPMIAAVGLGFLLLGGGSRRKVQANPRRHSSRKRR